MLTRIRFLEYFRKWKYFIAIFLILCTGLVYVFLNSRQEYTASVVIEYKNNGAINGYAPNGDPIDITEIYSSKTVTKALEQLSVPDMTVDEIRSRFDVTEIIPDEEQEKKAAAIKNNEEYSYFPTQYTVTFSVDHNYSKEFAQKVINAVLSTYFELYGEEYISGEAIPGNINSIISSDFDYLEQSEVINQNLDDINYYLNTLKTSYPDFRSSVSGYTFDDLSNEYQLLQDSHAERLSAYILNNKVTKDRAVLLKKYENRSANDLQTIESGEEKLKETLSLIQTYADKAKQSTQYNFGNDSNGGGKDNSNYILDNVYGDNLVTSKTTTYDNLIFEYVSLKDNVEKTRIDQDYVKMVMDTYSSKEENTTTQEDVVNEVQTRQNNILESMTSLYSKLTDTSTDLNKMLGGSNINVITNTVTTEKYNIKVYMFLAIFVFMVMGAFGVIILSRIFDLIDTAIYIDKKTGLPNKEKCDRYIQELEATSITGYYTVVSIQILNLSEINIGYGRKNGDKLLKQFGTAIGDSIDADSFANYNGGSQFFIFLPGYDLSRTELVINSFKDKLLNESEDLFNCKYGIGIAEAQSSDISNIHTLIMTALTGTKEITNGQKN